MTLLDLDQAAANKSSDKCCCPPLLYTQLDNIMPLNSFASWRDRKTTPLVDQILPLVADRGALGISRGELGRLVDLERDTLDALLDGFVRAGMLVLSNMNGVRIYRKADGSSQASALQLSNEPPSMLR